LQLHSRYIFKKTLANFAGLVAIFIFLIWFSRAISFVKYVTENGVGLSKFFYLFLLILPWLLLFIVPVSIFAAVLITYNRLIANNEITILKNSGLTKLAICRPIIGLIAISSIFCFLVSFYLMPYANKQLRLSRIDFKNNYANLAFSPQTFETLNSLTIYAKNRDENNNLFGILLHDERPSKYSITITAKKGNITTEDGSALLYMEGGTVQKFNYENSKSEILNFDNYVFNLTETQKNDNKMRWKAKERYLPELISPNDDSEETDFKKYRTELHQRITYPLLPVVFATIALACILRGGFNRGGNSSNIILAIILATTFLAITMLTYNLVESSAKLTPVLYLNFFAFFAFSLRMLTENNRKKS
jgi:lipopolysaccharide export system permease protein